MSGYSLYPLCVYLFFSFFFFSLEGEAWVGHRFEPLRQWVCPRLFGGVGWALKPMIHEQFLGQYQCHEYQSLQRFADNDKEVIKSVVVISH